MLSIDIPKLLAWKNDLVPISQPIFSFKFAFSIFLLVSAIMGNVYLFLVILFVLISELNAADGDFYGGTLRYEKNDKVSLFKKKIWLFTMFSTALT